LTRRASSLYKFTIGSRWCTRLSVMYSEARPCIERSGLIPSWSQEVESRTFTTRRQVPVSPRYPMSPSLEFGEGFCAGFGRYKSCFSLVVALIGIPRSHGQILLLPRGTELSSVPSFGLNCKKSQASLLSIETSLLTSKLLSIENSFLNIETI